MNLENEYASAFREAFGLEEESDVTALSYQGITEWDSVGHMTLVGILEDKFGLLIDMDDVIDFESYEKGKEILLKYGVTV